MNTVSISALALALASALTVSPAWAATNYANAPNGAHYRQGFTEPVCTPEDLTVTCTGTQIAGVGNTNATLLLLATYTATVQCENRGGNIVEAQSDVTSSTSTRLVPNRRNGTLIVPEATAMPPSDADFEEDAECPNGNWNEQVQPESIRLSGYTYTLTFDGFTQPFISLP